MATPSDDVVARATRGDRTALRELLRGFEPTVRAIARRVALPPDPLHDDAAQEARLGVLRALQTYDPQRGPFDRYARRWARYYVQREVAQTRRYRHHHDAGDGDAPSHDATTDVVFARQLVQRSPLTPAQRDILRRLVVEQEHEADVARALGVAVRTVQERKRAALQALRGELRGRKHPPGSADI